jgi:hypothetical protein
MTVVHKTLGLVGLSAASGDTRGFDKLEVRRHGRS